jgi:hypothetical protein
MQVFIAWLVPFFVWIASGLVQRILVGAGLVLVVGSGFDVMINRSLDAASNMLSSGGAALEFARLLGVGDFLTIVGTALVTRAYITITSGVLGLKTK